MHNLLRAGFILGLVPVAMGSGVAWAEETDAAEAGVCSITAVVRSKDLAARNVHAGPDADTPVLTQLPGPYTVVGDHFFPEVEITGSQDGWFRIDRARTYLYIVETPVRLLFEGEGWIRGRVLDLSVEGPPLFSRPSHDSPVVFDFSTGVSTHQGVSFFDLDRLVACQGYWVEVEGTYFGKPLRGWTRDTCASQVTTCP